MHGLCLRWPARRRDFTLGGGQCALSPLLDWIGTMEQIEIPDFDEDGDASFDFGAPSNGFNWGGNSWKAPRPPFAQSHTADFTTGSSGSPYASVNNTSNSSLASSHFGSSHSRNRSFASQKLHQGTSQEAISLNGQLSNVSSSSNLTFQLGGQAAPAEQQSLSAASGHSNTYDTSSPYYTALLLVLDQFLSSAESKISDILGRPVVISIILRSTACLTECRSTGPVHLSAEHPRSRCRPGLRPPARFAG